jgi:serine/threonine-protein kinase HipA
VKSWQRIVPKNAAVEVFASGSRAGALSRSDLEGDSFLFDYLDGCPAADAISLLMPVVRDQYLSTGGLLPVFEMNLPEGALLEKLQLLFAKAVPHFDDLELLAIVGQSQIGRLRYARPGIMPGDVPAQSLREILTYSGTEDLFKDLVSQYATYSGISGLQPKVLLRAAETHLPRTTHLGATHIVKSFNPKEYPELAANEFFCMRAALHAGIPVPKFQLSENRQILAIERFDLRPEGSYLGVEDFCVLNGLRSHGRYEGSYERIAKRIEQFVSPAGLRPAQEQFFSMLALSCAIENGDAHLKNFAVLYEHAEAEVRLAPAYDVLCTTPYVPRDSLALTLAGSKQFPDRKTLLAFARQACSLSDAQAAGLLEKVAGGIASSIEEIRRYTAEHRDFGRAGERFIETFERGITRSIRP